MEKKKNRYLQIIKSIFDQHYKRGASAIEFTRKDIVTAAQRLKVDLPKNLGDVLYSLDNLIALFVFERVDGSIKVVDEKHYRLVRPDELSTQELLSYQGRQA